MRILRHPQGVRIGGGPPRGLLLKSEACWPSSGWTTVAMPRTLPEGYSVLYDILNASFSFPRPFYNLRYNIMHAPFSSALPQFFNPEVRHSETLGGRRVRGRLAHQWILVRRGWWKLRRCHVIFRGGHGCGTGCVHRGTRRATRWTTSRWPRRRISVSILFRTTQRVLVSDPVI